MSLLLLESGQDDGGGTVVDASSPRREVAQDSQWEERNPDGVAGVRTLLYSAKNGSGEWGFEEDRRKADGWIAQDGSNRWGIDTTAQRGGYVIEIGGLAVVKV